MGLLSSPDLRTRSPSQGLKQASGAAEITVQPTTALNNSRLTSADIRGMGKPSAAHVMIAGMECILMAHRPWSITDLASYPSLRQAASAFVHCGK